MIAFIGGELFFTIIIFLILLETVAIAIPVASNSWHHVSREAILLTCSGVIVVCCRLLIRSQLDNQKYSWWGNLCWFYLAISGIRLTWEFITGRTGWPMYRRERKKKNDS